MSLHLFSIAHSGVFSHSALCRSDGKTSRGSQLQRSADSVSKKKLPNVHMLMTQDIQTQTDFLPTCTIDRFFSIFIGVMYGELSIILDILNSGYGCLHIDNSLILINFNMESKSFN